MRARIVVEAHELGDESSKLWLAEDEDVIEQLAAKGPREPFHVLRSELTDSGGQGAPDALRCSLMSRAARKPKADAAREALARAPMGGPLTDEEQHRDEAIRRRGPVQPVPHAELLRQLEERTRRGS